MTAAERAEVEMRAVVEETEGTQQTERTGRSKEEQVKEKMQMFIDFLMDGDENESPDLVKDKDYPQGFEVMGLAKLSEDF